MDIDVKNIQRRNPIKRNGLFVSPNELKLTEKFSMEFIGRVMNQTVVLYQVDHEKTKIDDIYKEARFKDLVFKTPLELNAVYTLSDDTLKAYSNKGNNGVYANIGTLEVSVLERELEENGCDIKRGDYIGIQVTPVHMEFFVVTDDGRVNYDNRHTLFGTLPFYRSVKCSIVSDVTETINMG